MAKFNFNLRNPQETIKETLQVKTPINFVIRWNNQRLVYPTGITILPKFWEGNKSKGKKYQRAKEVKQFPQYPELNRRLDNILSDASNSFQGFINNKKRQPTINEFREVLDKTLNPKIETDINLYKFVEKFIKESKEGRRMPKSNKPYSPNTIKSYEYSFNYVKEYATHKNRHIDFDTIDLDFYYNFTTYLSKEKTLSENSIGKIIKILKVLLNEATDNGVNKNLSYRSKRFIATSEEVDNVYLTDSELKELYELNLEENKRLEKVRDLFYIGCVTGLRFSDLSRIKKENIKKNELQIKTQKTGNSIVIPLEKEVFSIMKRYDNKFPTALSNQKMNEYIKEVCKMVPKLKQTVEITIAKGGLKIIENKPKYKLVTTHTCRRSFATNSYHKEIPPLAIMGVTGHKTESSFYKYIKITPNEKAKMFKLYSDRYNKLKVV